MNNKGDWKMHAVDVAQAGALYVPLEEAPQAGDGAQAQQEIPKRPFGEKMFLFSTEKSSQTATLFFQELYSRERSKTPIEFVPVYDWSPSPTDLSSGSTSGKEIFVETEESPCRYISKDEKKSTSVLEGQEQSVTSKGVHAMLQ